MKCLKKYKAVEYGIAESINGDAGSDTSGNRKSIWPESARASIESKQIKNLYTQWWLPLLRNPVQTTPNGTPELHVLVFHETPRRVFPSNCIRCTITLWMSPKRIPEKAITRNVPRIKISAGVAALWRIRLSHWTKTMRGRGNDSLRSVTNLVLQKLDTIGEKQCWKHVSPKVLNAQRMAFSVMLLNRPTSDAPVINRSAILMSSKSAREIRKFLHNSPNERRQLRYRSMVLGENPSKILSKCDWPLSLFWSLVKRSEYHTYNCKKAGIRDVTAMDSLECRIRVISWGFPGWLLATLDGLATAGIWFTILLEDFCNSGKSRGNIKLWMDVLVNSGLLNALGCNSATLWKDPDDLEGCCNGRSRASPEIGKRRIAGGCLGFATDLLSWYFGAMRGPSEKIGLGKGWFFSDSKSGSIPSASQLPSDRQSMVMTRNLNLWLYLAWNLVHFSSLCCQFWGLQIKATIAGLHRPGQMKIANCTVEACTLKKSEPWATKWKQLPHGCKMKKAVCCLCCVLFFLFFLKSALVCMPSTFCLIQNLTTN